MKFRANGRGGGFSRSSAAPAAEQAGTLLAAADSLAANYELTQGSLAGRLFYARALEVGYREIGGSEWPYEGELAEIDDPLIRDDRGVVFELPDGTLAWLALGYGWFHATVAAPTRDAVTEAFEAFAAQYPALYREAVDDQTVPITFWTDSKNGPVSRLRIIDASPWGEIERNYSRDVRDELGPLMKDFEPGKSGQLLLWQGPPGTGKSWALRALASEWRSWAEFNYITDPDAFFVTNPSYLIDVLLHESYEELVVLEEEGDAEVVSTDKLGKWRVLILEDTGELLAANAKESYGQGLSRLLNVVDGLVGQGLRVLVLVTTNDELGELHPAVKRPGRCASQIEFGPLSAEDASAWLGEETDEGGTLAELYARRGEGEEALEADESLAASAVDGSGGAMVAIFPTPPQADALAIEGGQPAGELHVTLVYLGQASDVDLRKVEDALGDDLGKPLSGQAGEVFQFSEGEDGTPLNVSPDVPGLADFRAEILRRLNAAGIEDASSYPEWVPHICLGYDVDPSEAEAKVGLPLSFDHVAVVVGGDRTNVPLTASAEATPSERWDRLARELEDEIEPEPVVASGGSAGSLAVLRLAAEEIDAARQREYEVFAAKSREDRGLMREVLSALHTLAGKPAGDTHITMPATELRPHVTIHEPPITVEAAPTPDVNVSVEPAQVTVEAAPTPNVEVTVQPPNVEVQPPEVSLAAPEIHVTVEQPQRPSSVRAIKNDDGSTVFTVEPDDDEE